MYMQGETWGWGETGAKTIDRENAQPSHFVHECVCTIHTHVPAAASARRRRCTPTRPQTP
jgi:hypothetical protein